MYGKLVSDDERINEVNEILHEVFVEEFKFKNDDDIFDISGNKVFHALIYEGLKEDKAVAAGRLIVNNENAYIKWIAVRKNYRNRQYGDMIARMLIDKAKSLLIEDIFVDVPVNLAGMFKKIGFKSYYEEKNSNITKNYIIMKYNNGQLNCCKNI